MITSLPLTGRAGGGVRVWEITGIPAIADHDEILAHLAQHKILYIIGSHELTVEPVSFFPETLLCCLKLEPSSRILVGTKKTETLHQRTAFYFLFRTTPGKQQFIPIADGAGNLVVANRHLELQLTSNQQRLEYAKFYFAFARSGRPPAFRHLATSPAGLRFRSGATRERVLLAQGALWRFMDEATRSRLVVEFQRRGIFPGRTRHHAHVPVQYGKEIHDVDINIWQSDGHITDTKFELLYADDELAEEPRTRVGQLAMPPYVTRHERWLARYRNLHAALAQLAYVAMTAIFFAASAIALIFLMEAFDITLVRSILSSTVGGGWRLVVCVACIYCIVHFAATTFLALDVDRIRSSILTLRPSLAGGRLDEWLYNKARRQQMRDRAARAGILRRIGLAITFLMTWLSYLVLVFTSLQLSLRPQLLTEVGAIGQIMTIFAQQALQYIPVVFYYVGRSSMDQAKLHFVDLPVMLVFQFSVGLLVIRRIHRFWSSTSRARRLRR